MQKNISKNIKDEETEHFIISPEDIINFSKNIWYNTLPSDEEEYIKDWQWVDVDWLKDTKIKSKKSKYLDTLSILPRKTTNNRE